METPDKRPDARRGIAAKPPKPIADWIAEVAALPTVRSVWLYGSRARGSARPDSDWDVGVVVDDKEDTALSACVARCAEEDGLAGFGAHGPVLVESDVFQREANVYPNISHDIALGALLAGEDSREDTTPTVDAAEVSYKLVWWAAKTVTDIAFAIRHLGDVAATDDDFYLAEAASNAARASDWTTKMICLAVGASHAIARDLDAVLDVVPPDWRNDLPRMRRDAHNQRRVLDDGDVPIDSVDEVRARLDATLATHERLAAFGPPIDANGAKLLRRRIDSAIRLEIEISLVYERETDDPLVDRLRAVCEKWLAVADAILEGAPDDRPAKPQRARAP